MTTSVILHIGQMKTGSTAIQKTLNANRGRLRKDGVLYTAPPGIRFCHHFLVPLVLPQAQVAQHILNGMGYDRGSCVAMAQAGWEALRAEAADPSVRTVLLSTETLFHPLTPEEGTRLRGLLEQISPDIRVLAYLRSPVAQYLSLVQQALKFQSGLLPLTPNKILPVIEAYEAAFPGRVELRIFAREDLQGGDVVTDFLGWAGVAGDLDRSKGAERNVSLSAEAMSVLERLNPPARATDAAGHERERARLKLVEAADQALPGATRPRLRPQIADHLVRTNTELLALRDRFGLTFGDIDYSLVGQPAGPLPPPRSVGDICAFDVERRDRIEETVRREMLPGWRQGLGRIFGYARGQ
jgi:hypothetical protein